jgi:hypothetical protein
MRQLPDDYDSEGHQIQWRWIKGAFVFYGVLLILAAGIVAGNQLFNGPTRETALAEARSEKLQTAIRSPRPMRQATKRD